MTDAECREHLFRLIGFLEFTVPNLRTSLRETSLRALERKVESLKQLGTGNEMLVDTCVSVNRRNGQLSN